MTALEWLPSALQDLQRIQLFIEKEHPPSALEALRRIKKSASLLMDFPEMGIKIAPDSRYREFPVYFGRGAYILRYHYNQRLKRVIITRVWHSRENRTN